MVKDTSKWGSDTARRRYAEGGKAPFVTKKDEMVSGGGGGGGGTLKLPQNRSPQEARGPIGPPSGTHPVTGERLRPDKMLMDEHARGYYRGPIDKEPYDGMRRNQFWRRIVNEPLPEYRRGGRSKKGRK